ncbi:MAG: glycosyltransferase family 2 protein [Candidatus Azobacteroides sp.]|nr:glycosyltransferase family 2 protein [Candidatus Azobacteroides sp.]
MKEVKISSNTLILNERKYVDGLVKNLLDAQVDEILFLDGGSTDGTYELLLDYEKQYPDRITIVQWKQPANSMFKDAFRESVRRNVLKDISTGDYILVIDADERINLDFKKYIKISKASIAAPWLQLWGDKIRVNTQDDKAWHPGYRVRLMRNVFDLRFQQYSNMGIHYNIAKKGHRLFFGFNKSPLLKTLFSIYNKLWGFSYIICDKIVIYHLHYKNLSEFKKNDLRINEKEYTVIPVNKVEEGMNYNLSDKNVCCLNSEIDPDLQTFLNKYN